MDPTLHILVVDDDRGILKTFQDLLGKREEFILRTSSSSEEAWTLLEQEPSDVGIFDIRMPGTDGLELLSRVKKKFPNLKVLMLTGSSSIDDAVRAIKLGALDYITKPFKVSHLTAKLEHLARHKRLEYENKILKEKLGNHVGLGGLVGMTPPMVQIRQMIQQLREDESNMLIMGESGTGKEMIARAIYEEGTRRKGPFITVDCASIHKNLLESELFGHEKGAFTGAYTKKQGLFEKANHGTLFLDEVGEIPIELQPALLRVIEEKKIRAVGGTDTVDIDCRIMAATNRDLDDMISKDLFRRDLYYRLNVVMITAPPLRERKDDIPLLVEHFIRKHGDLNRRKVTGVAREAVFVLMRYDWPGNIRELEHVILRAFAVGKSDQIQVGDLPPSLIHKAEEKSHGLFVSSGRARSLEEVETDVIIRTLTENLGDTARTSEMLGIDRSTLYRKIKRYKIDIDKLKIITKESA